MVAQEEYQLVALEEYQLVALEPLARIAYNRHLDALAIKPPIVARLEQAPRPFLDMPFSRELMAELTGIGLPSAPSVVRETPPPWQAHFLLPPTSAQKMRQKVIPAVASSKAQQTIIIVSIISPIVPVSG